MPMKCIAHMPPPIVIAAATSHARRASPRASPTCAARSRAVYDAKQATRIDRATRYGLYVPVTTIGIAPIFGSQAKPATKSTKDRSWPLLPDDLVRDRQDAPWALCWQDT